MQTSPIPLLLAGALALACAGSPPGARSASPEVDEDASTLAYLRQLRDEAERSRYAPRESAAYAQELTRLLKAKRAYPIGPRLLAVVPEVVRVLDASVVAFPAEASTMGDRKGRLLYAAGDPDGALAAFEASLRARPTLGALVGLLQIQDERGIHDQVAQRCKQVRPFLRDPEDVFTLLDVAMLRSHAVSVDVGLAWASEEDRAAYRRRKGQRQADLRDMEQRVAAGKRYNGDLLRQAMERDKDKPGTLRSFLDCADRCMELPPTCRVVCGGARNCTTVCDDQAGICSQRCVPY